MWLPADQDPRDRSRRRRCHCSACSGTWPWVERSWFRRVLQDQPHLPKLYVTEEDSDLDFNGAGADPAVSEQPWTAWRREVKVADVWLGKGTPFDAADSRDGDDIEVRDVLVWSTLSRSTPAPLGAPACCASASTAAPVNERHLAKVAAQSPLAANADP